VCAYRLRHFARKTGPEGFEIDLFDVDHVARSGHLLLDSGLTWYWQSRWPVRDAATAPEPRLLTRLTSETANDLVADAAARDVDAYGRFIAMFACRPEDERELADEIDPAIRRFAVHEARPICAIVIQIGDAEHELAYVPHRADTRIQALIAALGPGPRAYDVVPYRRLSTAALEVQLGLSSAR